MQRQQSTVRVWRSNYINFILKHNKITHRERCSTNGVWGSWSWLFSHRDSDSNLSAITAAQHPFIAEMPYEKAITITNSWLEILAIGPSRERYVISTVPDFYLRPASFVQMARPSAPQGTAHSASATCSSVIYLNSI
ncbi:hypothetical protein Zmor_007161 [Zophobas morio]|uniref:Uncharacterized protein n=1 Tax=Zophobas morio TaxID=2755281 RepID=A0AA38IWT7_9CUCU|nr:hypothetical protein Zmor_007161 [Zophobas morio]